MCTWFYVESKPLSQYIEKAKSSPLVNDIMVDMAKNIAMHGDISRLTLRQSSLLQEMVV